MLILLLSHKVNIPPTRYLSSIGSNTHILKTILEILNAFIKFNYEL